MLQHTDFGEKIGGARKDLWKERGLYVSDLADMNDREAETYVKKANIWQKPDYAAMVAAGTPLGVAYFVKLVRDSYPASPRYLRTDTTPEKRRERQKQYVETARELDDILNGVSAFKDVQTAFERLWLPHVRVCRKHKVLESYSQDCQQSSHYQQAHQRYALQVCARG